jgi:hypothetical protein
MPGHAANNRLEFWAWVALRFLDGDGDGAAGEYRNTAETSAECIDKDSRHA